MKTIIFTSLIALAILLGPIPAQAGTVTIDFGGNVKVYTMSAEDEVFYQAFVDHASLTKDMDGDGKFCADDNGTAEGNVPETCWSMESYYNSLTKAAMGSYIKQAKKQENDDACIVTWKTLSAEDKASIKALFGGKNPCKD